MYNRFGTTLVALAMSVGSASSLRAQGSDSSHKFSIFGGSLVNANNSNKSLLNTEVGGSLDFHVPNVPLTLRSTLAFRQEQNDFTVSSPKYGTLSLDVIGKPIPKIFGIQPYLLGGLGVGTRSEYLIAVPVYDLTGMRNDYRFLAFPRHTWAFAEGGVGLELGHHLFMQTKIMTPIASQGPVLMPFSVGFRFWD
ncbi:MAG: hypothetical protein ABJE10_18895 [bacterium]